MLATGLYHEPRFSGRRAHALPLSYPDILIIPVYTGSTGIPKVLLFCHLLISTKDISELVF